MTDLYVFMVFGGIVGLLGMGIGYLYGKWDRRRRPTYVKIERVQRRASQINQIRRDPSPRPR